MIIKQLKKASDSLSVFLLGLTLFLTFNTNLFSATTPPLAKTWYVKPSSEVVVRKGQGNDYKITAIVKNGTSLKVLEETESYARVRLTDGKEGWMLKRFLSTDTPLEEVVISLRTEKEKIEQNASDLAQKLKEVSSALAQTKRELTSTLAQKEQIITQYQTLQRDTADVLQTKTDLLQATKANEELIKKLTSIKEENNSLKKDTTIKWFLAGGGVLFLGILFGKIPSQSRRKKSLL